MAKLAILGHLTRGKEVIELLEMLGGKNDKNYMGMYMNCIYFINDYGYIEYCDRTQHLDYEQLTLEEFEERFPYKVGDKVIIKAKNQEAIIDKIVWCYNTIIYWSKYDGIIEGNWRVEHLQPYKEETMEKGIIYDEIDFNRCPHADKVELILGDNYEIQVAEGKTYVVKKKPQYPKTYEECCIVLQDTCMTHKGGYKGNLIQTFQKLLICRDAYWKIAGEELELDKPWKPKFSKYTHYSIKFYLYQDSFVLHKGEHNSSDNCILVFPTEEMRDEFYNNFKDLIENCKELL